MELIFDVDWRQVFIPTSSVIEMVVRGTIMYLGMFVLLRIFRRQAGSLSVADLLLIVIIADAAQNGMAGEAKSLTEALVLILTIIFWDYTIDWLGFKSQVMAKVLEPQPLLLIKNGKVIKRNLAREMITEDELLGEMRVQGVDDINEVRECRLESSGDFSVLLKGGRRNKGSKKDNRAIN